MHFSTRRGPIEFWVQLEPQRGRGRSFRWGFTNRHPRPIAIKFALEEDLGLGVRVYDVATGKGGVFVASKPPSYERKDELTPLQPGESVSAGHSLSYPMLEEYGRPYDVFVDVVATPGVIVDGQEQQLEVMVRARLVDTEPPAP